MKVEWIHDFLEEPYLIYGELCDDLEEIRKVEIYKSGDIGYVKRNGDKYHAYTAEMNWSKKDEIEKDPQFKVEVISKTEFEKMWDKAIKTNMNYFNR